MRHVDISQTQFPDGWQTRAQQAASDTANASQNDRSAVINGHSGVWRDLKPALRILRKGKCWYCESKENRSDCAVDHYRPKNSVVECDHPGYWWLAFAPDNYRFCCTFCNSRRKDEIHGTSGGKHDHFPIYDESLRAYRDTDDIGNEQPLLLDPAYSADPPLLWFDEDGHATGNSTIAITEYLKKRVDTSINFYHLNHVPLVEARRDVVNAIKARVRSADRQLGRFQQGQQGPREALSDAIDEVKRMIHPDSEYSAAARSVLRGMVGSSPAAEAILGC